MSRDLREAPTRDDIVYIDLGSEDSAQAGEFVTIFRKLGKGNIVETERAEGISERSRRWISKPRLSRR